MGQPSYIVPTWWKSIMTLVLVVVVLSVSACTAPGHLSSTPSAQPAEEGRSGSRARGNGGGY
jgi:hypothetical protein